MEFSKRIEYICSMIDECDTIADIGCDHGYIGIKAISDKRCKNVISTDISKPSLEKAIFNISGSEFEDNFKFRVGSGLEVINPSEVDAAIIAGMGGNLICDLIDNSMEVFKTLKYLIVQPVQNVEVLREYIYKNGFKIIKEGIIKDEDKFYPTLKIEYANNDINQLNEIELLIGKGVLENLSKDGIEYIELLKVKFEKIIESIKVTSEAGEIRKKQVLHNIEKLKVILDENKRV